MPPRKTTKTLAKDINTDSETNDSSQILIDNNNSTVLPTSSMQPTATTPSMYLSTTGTKSTESDRMQLAQAINNFTIKSEQFLQEMKHFDTFRENVFKLDLLIDSKKQEYNHTITLLEQEYLGKKKNLETQHNELEKKLKSDHDDLVKKLGSEHVDRTKKCETEYADKNKLLANTYEDESINMRRKLELDKTKACFDYAKGLGMRFVKEDEYKTLNESVQKAVHDYTELKKSFDKQCNQIRDEEKVRYQSKLEADVVTIDLKHKAASAQLVAQVEQQKKEIMVLNDTIANLKFELKEQRELTKEVAQASSKSQINQTIGKA